MFNEQECSIAYLYQFNLQRKIWKVWKRSYFVSETEHLYQCCGNSAVIDNFTAVELKISLNHKTLVLWATDSKEKN